MKFWFGLVLFLLICGLSYGKNNALPDTTSQAKLKNSIDHLNEVVYDTFLKTPDSARNLAEQALLLSEKIKYPVGIAQSYFNIGTIYWAQSYYPIALFYMNSALAVVPYDKPLIMSDIYSGIGRVYADLGDYKKAMYNLNKCERYAGNDKLRLGEAYSEKSYVCMKMGNYDRAIRQARLSLKLNLEVKEFMGAAIVYSRLGDIYYDKKDYIKALAYDDTAFKSSVKLKMNRLRAGMYNEYADINNNLHQYDKGIAFARKGLALYDSIGVMKGLSESYKLLITSFEAKNDLKQALFYERRYNQIQDSLNTVDKTRSTQLIQNYFALNARLHDMDLVEKKNEDNKSKIKFQHTIINILAVSLLFVFAALSVTFYYYNQKKVLSKKLQEQHNALFDQKQLIELQAANLEVLNTLKNKMLAVVGHDLRTPVSNLQNMIEMFERADLTAADIHKLMQDINPIVKATELTLSNLLDWAGSQVKGRSVDVTDIDVAVLGSEMEQTFKYLLDLKNIGFTNNISPGHPVSADENHIKIILRNLISNAVKFTDHGGHVTLSADVAPGKLVVIIEDTGRGLTAAEIEKLFSPETHFSQYGTSGEQGTGIGLLLCKELVELNGGTLNVTSIAGKGSRFYFDLPLVK